MGTIRPGLAILAGTVWSSINAFLCNQLLLIDHWTAHYTSMGLTFPDEPSNGVVQGIWSLCIAVAVFFVARCSSLLGTSILAW